MRMHVRGTGSDGEPVEVDLDLPSTLKVGDTFAFGDPDGEREDVEVIGMETEPGPDGTLTTTIIVGAIPVYWRISDPAKTS
jgi:pSer/pThr/pTyr-binding forkhead associated (FHA) protein